MILKEPRNYGHTPQRYGDYEYFSVSGESVWRFCFRFVIAIQEYDVWYRRLLNSKEEVEVLDENTLYRGFYTHGNTGYFRLGSFVPSDDGR
jgi:hypothetical protein